MEKYMGNFKVEFQPKLTSKEKSLFRYLLDAKKGRGSSRIKCSLEETAHRMKIEVGEVDNSIKKLMKKQFFLYEGEETLYSNVFEYIKIQETDIYFAFVKKIFAELDENKNFLGIDLTPFFYFNEKFTGKFYIDILNKMRNSSRKFEYSLDEFKEILEVGESYGRFYDFERFVLKKLVKDINENTKIDIEYDRLQMSEKKGSKVVGIRIDVSGENPHVKRTFKEEVLALVGDRIKDKSEIGKVAEALEGKIKLEEVGEVIRFNLKHSKDENLEKDMLNALVKLASDDKLLHLEEFKYTNIFAIQSKIIRKLKTIYPEHLLYDSFFSHGLLKELYKFKNKKDFKFKLDKLEIMMLLNDDKNVKMEFWERN